MLSSTSLLHGNCVFNRNNTVATQQGMKTYWLCKSYRITMCRARCITHQGRVISSTGMHNHPPHMKGSFPNYESNGNSVSVSMRLPPVLTPPSITTSQSHSPPVAHAHSNTSIPSSQQHLHEPNEVQTHVGHTNQHHVSTNVTIQHSHVTSQQHHSDHVEVPMSPSPIIHHNNNAIQNMMQNVLHQNNLTYLNSLPSGHSHLSHLNSVNSANNLHDTSGDGQESLSEMSSSNSVRTSIQHQHSHIARHHLTSDLNRLSHMQTHQPNAIHHGTSHNNQHSSENDNISSIQSPSIDNRQQSHQSQSQSQSLQENGPVVSLSNELTGTGSFKLEQI